MGELRIEWIGEADAARSERARALVRSHVLDHALIYASLECPPIRERSRLLAVEQGERLVGLAAVVDGVFPYRCVPLCAALPGVSQALLSRVDPPFVAFAAQPLWHEVERCGGQCEREEIQMARLHPAALPDPDPSPKRLERSEEIEALASSGFSAVHMEAGPFLGVRGADGELLAFGGVHFVTDRVAQIATIQTRPNGRRERLETAVLVGLVRELETEQRRVVLQVRTEDEAAAQRYAAFGFRGRIRTARFAFDEPVPPPPSRSACAGGRASGGGGPGADLLER